MDESYFKFYIGKRLFHHAFRKYGKPRLTGKVLDLGAGESPYKDSLEHCQILTLEHTVRHRPTIVGSAMDLPLASSSFDGIICTEVIEHLPEPLECLKEIRRVLKPKGIVYLTSPMTWYLHYQPHDYFRFTPHGLKHLFEKAGLEVKETFTIGRLFTILSVVLCEKLYNLIFKLFFFLPKKARPYLVIPILFPLSWCLFHLSRGLDFMGKRWIFSVGMVGAKKVTSQ